MKLLTFILIIMITNSECRPGREIAQPQKTTPLLVRKCTDFDLTGKGDNNEWTKAEWNYLTKLDSGGKIYASKFKILILQKVSMFSSAAMMIKSLRNTIRILETCFMGML